MKFCGSQDNLKRYVAEITFLRIGIISASIGNFALIYSKKRWLRIIAKYFEMFAWARVG
jgi:hypothetical protein